MRRTACLLGMLLVALWAALMGRMSACAQSEGVTRPDHAPRWGTGDAAFTVTSAKIRLDPEGTDEFTILASFSNLSLVSGQTVLFWAGYFYDQIPVDQFKQEGQKYTYTGPQGEPGLSKLVLDLDRGNATIIGKDLFLSGISNPLPIGLIVGAFDQCTMLAFNVKGNVWTLKNGENSSFACVIPDAPALSARGVYVGKAQKINVSALIAPYEGLAENSIQLVRVDNSLKVVGTPLCSLLDNGKALDGDQSAGDRVFSCVGTIKAKAPGTINLAVRAQVGGIMVFSPGVALEAVNEVTPTKFNQTVQAHAKAVQIWKNKESQYGATRDARVKAAAQIKKVPGVKDAGLSTDNATIWIDFQSGVKGGLVIDPLDNSGSQELFRIQPTADLNAARLTTKQTPSVWGQAPRLAATSGSVQKVANCDVFIYNPFEDEFWKDVAFQLKSLFENPDDREQFKVKYLQNTDATVAALKDPAEYGTVVINSHGGTLGNEPFVMTREVFDELKYRGEVSRGELTRQWYKELNTYYYAFTPRFVPDVLRSVKNGIAYVNACFSAVNNSFARAFMKRGASAYFGYAWTTDGNFSCDTAEILFDGLVSKHLHTGQAMARVPKEYKSQGFRGLKGKSGFAKYACRQNPYYLYKYAYWSVYIGATVDKINPDKTKDTYFDNSVYFNWYWQLSPDDTKFEGGFTGNFYQGEWKSIEDNHLYVKSALTLSDDYKSIETYSNATLFHDNTGSIFEGIAASNLPLTWNDGYVVQFSAYGEDACSHISKITRQSSTPDGTSWVFRDPKCNKDSYINIILQKQYDW